MNAERVISRSLYTKLSSTVAKGTDSSMIAQDLTGYKLWVTFTGFGVENMNCAIELNEKFEVKILLISLFSS
jgi:hypothetical protein